MKSANMPISPTLTQRSYKSPNGRMEAIACGVQARLDERTGYSRRVTDETVNIARNLGVTDREIKTWVNQRLKQMARDEERIRNIKILLDRIRRNMPNMSQ
jgi:energy-coupling factor transporter ATP-binding protein EcfA2